MTYPSDETTKLVIADDVRQEQGGKVTILGIYSGSVINVSLTMPSINSINLAPALPSLAFLWWFADGEGHFNMTASVTDPNGTIMFNLPNTNVQKNPDGDMNIMMKVAPFPLIAGEYKCSITLDQQEYRRSFKIVFG